MRKVLVPGYVKMQLAKQLARKRIWIVPASNVSTMNVNPMMDYLLRQQAEPKSGEDSAPSP